MRGQARPHHLTRQTQQRSTLPTSHGIPATHHVPSSHWTSPFFISSPISTPSILFHFATLSFPSGSSSPLSLTSSSLFRVSIAPILFSFLFLLGFFLPDLHLHFLLLILLLSDSHLFLLSSRFRIFVFSPLFSSREE